MDIQNRLLDTSIVQKKTGRITWLIYQRICRDPYRWTKINGQSVSISNRRHQYSPIDWLIDQSIDRSINGQTKRTDGHISRTTYSSTHLPTDLSTETWRFLLTDTDWRTGRVYFKSQTSIFTYRSIDWSINQSINGWTKWTEAYISISADSSIHLPTDLSTEMRRTHW